MNIGEINRKYDESFQFLEKWKRRKVAQLVLLNNLQRGDENIASTLMLTLFNRILSNLYDDKMQIKFVPGEELDQKKVQMLEILAQNDYREMEKDKLDYDWDWDTLFFGRGYMETLQFDKKRKILRPHVINPLAFGYDPYIANEQDWRYYWKWLTKTKRDLQLLIKARVLSISDPNEIPSGIEPYLWDYKTKREEAKLAVPQSNDVMSQDVYQILEFYGYDDDGEKCVYWTDKNWSKIIFQQKLDLRDGEDTIAPNGQIIKSGSNWPIVKKECFREPHSTINFSVADLIEDKHRARSVLLNLAFIAAKDKANPIYGYTPEKIRDVSQLFSRQINQHIPMDSPDAMWPLNTENPMDAGLMSFLQLLEKEANDPMGTGMALMQSKGKKTATESAIQQQLNDLAQSLQSKVMKSGEVEFWSHWWHRYKRFTKKGDEKIATITGVKGMTFEKIMLEDIHSKYPPGVLVYSAKDAEYKELVLRRDLMQMYPQFMQSLSPDGMRNFNKFVFFPKFLPDPTMIDILIPKTLDEIKAEHENEQLNGDILPVVAETDNHEQHIPIHYMAKNTWAKWTHIAWHEDLLALQKKQQQEQAMQQLQNGDNAEKPEIGAKKKDEQEAASPLKQEIGKEFAGKEQK